jgi:sugar O-acyltransferase (sialic acid O-acetyltransferase NeuD family)
MRKRALYIFGAGGLGREILSLVNATNEWEVSGFFDDGKLQSEHVSGIPVLGGTEEMQLLPEQSAVVYAIGDPLLKRSIVRRQKGRFHHPVLIHPKAIIQDPASVKLGAGTMVCAGAVLTCNILLGDHVLINLNSTIGHDSRIDSFTSIMPGVNIAGEVSVGEAVLLGSGCNIRNRIVVGNCAKVGMGAAVVRDVEPDATVAGVPAKVIR